MDKHYKDYIQIGLNIMRYRKEQGLTQDQLADMAGYSRNHLQRVETAVCKPTVGLSVCFWMWRRFSAYRSSG